MHGSLCSGGTQDYSRVTHGVHEYAWVLTRTHGVACVVAAGAAATESPAGTIFIGGTAPVHLRARLAAGPCVHERAGSTACANLVWLRALCDIAIFGYAAGTHPRARARARWRRHCAEHPRASCTHRVAMGSGRAAHCARHCAQGSRTARTTPTPARRARRRSSPRRRAPVRPQPSAGSTMAL